MKNIYSIDEISDLLKIKHSQIHYFIKKFNVTLQNVASKSTSRQMFTSEEYEILKKIKHLIIDEMYTIAGAQKKLNPLIKNYNTKLAVLADLETISGMLKD